MCADQQESRAARIVRRGLSFSLLQQELLLLLLRAAVAYRVRLMSQSRSFQVDRQS